MTRNRNNDASSRKKMNTCGGVGVPWPDINHDVLYSVMMRLGVFDFISFSGVCKSWRSLAVSNKKTFMASKPPMLMYKSYTMTCYLEDFEGRKFRTLIPQLVDRKCVGLTCGYLILFGQKARDFWLVNPITRHELHFPGVTFDVNVVHVRCVLVFSPSKYGWVFVVMNNISYQVWFSIEGKGTWNHVSYTLLILDLHAFKGKIYTLNFSNRYPVCEMRLDPVPKITLVNANFVESVSLYNFISLDKNLYLMDSVSRDMYKGHILGFDQLKWVPCEKTTRQEYAVFRSYSTFSVVKPESWAAPSSQYVGFFGTRKCGRDNSYIADMWYFPHDCLTVNLLDE